MPGISFTHSAHQVAQKFTTVTLPRSWEVVKLSPPSVTKRASGATRCGVARKAAKVAIATTAMAAISLVAVFKGACRMKDAIFAVFAALVMTWSAAAVAQLDRITNQDAVAGL